MRTWFFIIFLAASPAASPGDDTPPPAAAKPNILLIISDQHCADAMSGAGYAHAKTPALDALAATGVRFANTYCTYPGCTTSRASLMTSRWPHQLKGAGEDVEDGAPQPDAKAKKTRQQEGAFNNRSTST